MAAEENLIRRIYGIRPDQDDKLKSLARNLHYPEAYLVRKALDEFFAAHDPLDALLGDRRAAREGLSR